MNSITIIGADQALKAGGWCRQQFGSEWDLDLVLLGNDPVYTFKFYNPADASFFALKWK